MPIRAPATRTDQQLCQTTHRRRRTRRCMHDPRGGGRERNAKRSGFPCVEKRRRSGLYVPRYLSAGTHGRQLAVYASQLRQLRKKQLPSTTPISSDGRNKKNHGPKQTLEPPCAIHICRRMTRLFTCAEKNGGVSLLKFSTGESSLMAFLLLWS
jgi:hypothetical protein